jgi:hypothetical protein
MSTDVETDVALESIISPVHARPVVPPPPVRLDEEASGDGIIPNNPGADLSTNQDGPGATLRALIKPSVYYIVSRVAVLFAALAGNWLVPRLRPLHALATAWDGSWYLKIAQHGYPHGLFNEGIGSRWAFFPAFPAAIRAMVEVSGLSYANAALVLSFLFGLTSAIAIWLTVREVFGKVVADRSVLLYVFFPASYVLSMTYTEGLFLTAAGFCLFALSRRYWLTAAMFAGLAGVTRNFGFIMVICVAVVAIPEIRRQRRARPLVALILSGVPFLAWLLYSWRRAGTPLAFIKAEQFWPHSHFIWFLTPFLSLQHLLTGLHGFTNGQAVLATGALLFAYIGMAVLYRTRHEGIRVPAYWWVFTIGAVLAMMSPDSPTSILRYSMAAFPLFAAFAWKIRVNWEGAIVGVLAFAQGALVLVVLVGWLHPATSMILP